MTLAIAPRRYEIQGAISRPAVRPPAPFLEYGYYFATAYSILSAAIGISIPVIGGGLLFLVAALCVMHVRNRLSVVYAPVAPLLACALSLLMIQVLVHGESLAEASVRSFVTWTLGLLVIQPLRLRPGFVHRMARFLLAIAIAIVPYLTFSAIGVERAKIGLEVGGNLSHSGGLAEWSGFLAVYFAVLGAEHSRFTGRALAWLIAVGCVFVVGLTVSRSVLIATGLAVVVGLRRVLKRGVAALFLLIVVAAAASVSGIFEQTVVHYEERGAEDTGRTGLWPVVVRRFVNSPLVGVGVSRLATQPADRDEPIATPHNSFLYLALASGLLPPLFFIAFWIQAFRRSLSNPPAGEERPFRIPFLLFALPLATLGDLSFMSPWGLLALSVATGPVLPPIGRSRASVPRLDVNRYGMGAARRVRIVRPGVAPMVQIRGR